MYYVDKHALTRRALSIVKMSFIHESQNLPSVGQHNLWIKKLNKGYTYLSSVKFVIHAYMHGVTQVNFVISIIFDSMTA